MSCDSLVLEDASAIIETAQHVILLEQQALAAQLPGLSDSFVVLITHLQQRRGRIVLTAMGKSGYIARKCAATLSSLGVLSFFIHPAEALHGDLGMISQDDVILALSYSGATRDVLATVTVLKARGFRVLGMSSGPDTPLAQLVDAHHAVSVEREACYLNLAPTASTTALLAVCDAIAVVLARLSGCQASDFHQMHPGGMLGHQLSLLAHQVMRVPPSSPCVFEDVSLMTALPAMSAAGFGTLVVVSRSDEQVLGIFTDGDLRRRLQQDGAAALDMTMASIMQRETYMVFEDTSVRDIVLAVEKRCITQVPVLSQMGRVVGLIHLRDLLPVTGV